MWVLRVSYTLKVHSLDEILDSKEVADKGREENTGSGTEGNLYSCRKVKAENVLRKLDPNCKGSSGAWPGGGAEGARVNACVATSERSQGSAEGGCV